MWTYGEQIAKTYKHQHLETEHLLLALIEQEGLAKRIFHKANISINDLKKDTEKFTELKPKFQKEPEIIYIGKSLNKLLAGRTTLSIAHRLSTLEGADRILVMRDGEFVESGTHDALISIDSEYANLFQYQVHL